MLCAHVQDAGMCYMYRPGAYYVWEGRKKEVQRSCSAVSTLCEHAGGEDTLWDRDWRGSSFRLYGIEGQRQSTCANVLVLIDDVGSVRVFASGGILHEWS